VESQHDEPKQTEGAQQGTEAMSQEHGYAGRLRRGASRAERSRWFWWGRSRHLRRLLRHAGRVPFTSAPGSPPKPAAITLVTADRTTWTALASNPSRASIVDIARLQLGRPMNRTS